MTLKLVCSAVALGAALIVAGSASAKVYDFSFTDAANDTASGQFTTADANASTTVTGITGTFDTFAITGLSPYAGSDQVLTTGAAPNFDFGGISFSVANGNDYNLTDAQDLPLGSLLSSANDPGGNGIAPVALTSFTLSAVPEPATWGMMLMGFGGLGVAMRNSRRKLVTA
jgi:hypothetical protein